MTRSSFVLYTRLSMFEEEADYTERYEMDELKCPACHNDYIAIDRDFFETLA